MVDQPQRGEAVSECDPQAHTSVTETLPHTDDLCSGLTSEMAEAGRCPTAAESELWDLRDSEPTHAEDHFNSLATVSLSVPELIMHIHFFYMINSAVFFCFFKV